MSDKELERLARLEGKVAVVMAMVVAQLGLMGAVLAAVLLR